VIKFIHYILPPNPNQKPTKYKKIHTRVDKENKEKFGYIVDEILKGLITRPYPNVNLREVRGHGLSKKFNQFQILNSLKNRMLQFSRPIKGLEIQI